MYVSELGIKEIERVDQVGKILCEEFEVRESLVSLKVCWVGVFGI